VVGTDLCRSIRSPIATLGRAEAVRREKKIKKTKEKSRKCFNRSYGLLRTQEKAKARCVDRESCLPRPRFRDDWTMTSALFVYPLASLRNCTATLARDATTLADDNIAFNSVWLAPHSGAAAGSCHCHVNSSQLTAHSSQLLTLL
jgi:hypothetical protein